MISQTNFSSWFLIWFLQRNSHEFFKGSQLMISPNDFSWFLKMIDHSHLIFVSYHDFTKGFWHDIVWLFTDWCNGRDGNRTLPFNSEKKLASLPKLISQKNCSFWSFMNYPNDRSWFLKMISHLRSMYEFSWFLKLIFRPDFSWFLQKISHDWSK